MRPGLRRARNLPRSACRPAHVQSFVSVRLCLYVRVCAQLRTERVFVCGVRMAAGVQGRGRRRRSYGHKQHLSFLLFRRLWQSEGEGPHARVTDVVCTTPKILSFTTRGGGRGGRYRVRGREEWGETEGARVYVKLMYACLLCLQVYVCTRVCVCTFFYVCACVFIRNHTAATTARRGKEDDETEKAGGGGDHSRKGGGRGGWRNRTPDLSRFPFAAS